MTPQQKLFQKIWASLEDKPASWDLRGTGQAYVQPAVPVEVAKMSLNDKCRLYKEGVPRHMDVNDMAKMLTFMMTRHELSVLYNRFSTARKYADDSARRAWDALNAQDWRTGVREKKIKALAKHIVYPQKWEAFLVVETQELTKEQKNEKLWKPFYYGELEVTHGKTELDWMIQTNKVIEDVDSDGDTVYWKKTTEERETSSFKKRAKLQRDGRRLSKRL